MPAPGFPDSAQAAAILSALGLAVVVTDVTGTVTYWNAAAEQLYGWTPDEAVGRSINDLTVPDVTAEVSDDIMASLSTGGTWTGQFPCRRRDGSTFLALVSDAPVIAEDGTQIGIVGVSADLGQALAPLLVRSAETAVVFNADRTVRYSSPNHVTMLGFSVSELAGRDLAALVHPDDAEQLESFAARLAEAPGPLPPVEMRLRTSDGDWRWIEMAATNLLHDPVIHGYVVNLRDVTSRRQAQDELARLALHDSLTGLANRTLVMDRIQHVLEHAERTGRPAGTLLFVDLDAFKDVNDAIGHLGGDEMLREIATRLRAIVRSDDTCARLGGDEFLVVTESAVHEADALVLAERVHAALRRPIRLGDVDVLPAASIGITTIRPGQPDAHSVVREADVAMYRAKGRGPGRTELHHPGEELTGGTGALRTVGELRQALARHELLVHYQPIVDLRTRAVRGAEALVRWDHPEHGLLAPDTFIPLAERSGLIVQLGEFVLREACRYAADTDMPRQAQKMSVNLSPLQLEDDGLVPTVLDALRSSGLPPESLVLEVTEGTLLNEGERATRALAALRDAGVQVAIDDFGTGYAGFAYLKRFPADTLKIDASFVTGLGDGGADNAIVGSLVHLAHGLKLRVVAEGVETVAQADVLRGLGCELAQGFLFSPPRPPAQRTMDGRMSGLAAGDGG